MNAFRRLSLVALVSLLWASAQAAELEVHVEGARSTNGVLMLGLYETAEAFTKAPDLYDSVDGYLRDRGRVLGASIRLDSGIRVATFSGLKPGRYAVVVFHDQNRNGQFDKLLGLPKEVYGFSNNARGFLGPPDFDEAAVVLENGRKAITIELSF